MANKEMKTIQFPNSETVYEIVDNAAREALAGKQPSGDYATKTELEQGLAGKQPVGDYATNDELTSGLAEKQPVGDYATNTALTEGLAGKQPMGDYATNTALAKGLAQKQPTGDYALRSELPDVSAFITKSVSDLVNYYTKTEVDNKISTIPKFSIKVVDILPFDDISTTTIYLLKTPSGTNGDLYTEYIYVDGAWESLGTQTVDLSGYVTTEALNSAIAEFVTAEYVSTALAKYATTESLNAHTGNTNNPHSVTKSQVGLENVANERQYSSQNPPPYPVTSVAGRTGAVTLSKTDVGLSNVDNTSDTAKPVSTAQATAIAEAKQAGTNAQNAIDTHAAKVNNPHNVTAKQVGAYVKPAEGIPETDLAEDLQSKINNALQKAPNLLKNNVSITYTSAQSVVETGYSLGLVVGQKYNVVYTDNGTEKTATGKAVSIEGMLALAGENYSDEAQEWINIDGSLFFYGADGINSSYQPADDFLFIVDGSSSTERTIVFKSISEASTVIADKVKNLLKINVNGTAYNYDGSVETEINIETGGGGEPAAENLLQSSVTANRQAGVAEGDMVNLGYALGLEEGKEYTVKYKFNGSDIVATAKYEAVAEGTIEGATLALCQSISAEGQTMKMPMLLGVQNYNASLEEYQSAALDYGFLYIVDKHQITGDAIYTADENNSSAYVRALQSANAQNAVSVEITAIEPFAEVVADKVKNPLTIGDVVFDGSAAKTVALPNIPIPTAADVGKILKVNANGEYELVEA